MVRESQQRRTLGHWSSTDNRVYIRKLYPIIIFIDDNCTWSPHEWLKLNLERWLWSCEKVVTVQFGQLIEQNRKSYNLIKPNKIGTKIFLSVKASLSEPPRWHDCQQLDNVLFGLSLKSLQPWPWNLWQHLVVMIG